MAYKEGLGINPNDEYLYFNLASLYASIGVYRKADAMMNNAILNNPDRGLNYMFKVIWHWNGTSMKQQSKATATP